MATRPSFTSRAKKAVAAALGFAAAVVVNNPSVVPERFQGVALALIGLAGTYGVFKVRNAPDTTKSAKNEYLLDTRTN